MCSQRMQRCARRLRPPREATFREALETQPETLSIVDQKFEGGGAPVAKQKDGAGERVAVETVATQRGERINAFAEIHWLITEHDGELWRQLNHHVFTSAADSDTRLRGVAGLVKINEASGANRRRARRADAKTSQVRRRARDALLRVETEATPDQRHSV